MNTQIRRLGYAAIVLFIALFVQLNYLQVVDANKLDHHPGNTRGAVRDFTQPRGVIQTADGVLLAQSVPSNDSFQRQRQYPQGKLYAQITGFFSFNFGSEGVEAVYNNDLAGRTAPLRLSGLADLLLDRKRTGNVTLTVVSKVQQAAQAALGDRKGAVVALDVKTGGVLALWSFPSYDPNVLASHNLKGVADAYALLNIDKNQPRLARAYRERYFPGSSFKIITSATALATGVDVDKSFPSITQLPLPNTGGQTLRNFGGERCGGRLPDILRVSCNTAFAQLGLDLGGDKLSAGAEAFGFDHRPPIDLQPGAATSVFPDATAFIHDKPGLAKSAIGQQDVTATPLQMALVAAGIANDGVIMTPHVMAEVRDSEGQIVKRYKPHPWLTAVSADVAHGVRDLMIGVVNAGTGTAAQIPGIQVAGKTGTAQTGRNTTHTWFVAFAPADAPRVAVAVIVEDQPNVPEATGGLIAAPIAKAVLQAALAGP